MSKLHKPSNDLVKRSLVGYVKLLGVVRTLLLAVSGISANRCSQLHFNGGGHENAAGGRLRIPQDVAGIEEAAAYIEEHTHIFMTKENED